MIASLYLLKGYYHSEKVYSLFGESEYTFFTTIRSSLLYHYFLALFLSIKQSGRLLERLRHKPVDADVGVHVYVTTVEAQGASVITKARASTRRPVGTVRTKVVKHTVVVKAQRREEEILTNLAILWLA